MAKSYKETILAKIDKAVDNGRPQDEGNLGPLLVEIFAWQEVASYAKKALETCWEAAQKEGAIPTDDELRELSEGENIVAESDCFSVLAKVSAPRKNFDRDMFIDVIAHKYKIKKTTLITLAEECKKETVPVLSKRIVEV